MGRFRVWMRGRGDFRVGSPSFKIIFWYDFTGWAIGFRPFQKTPVSKFLDLPLLEDKYASLVLKCC